LADDAVALSDVLSAFSDELLLRLDDESVSLGAGFRLSVMYQPDPLNTIPAGNNTRRTALPHSGHSVTGGSENRCIRSKRLLQAEHSYS
jgi:hypothetical protein